jgi:putative DNA primase/helicase
MQILRDLTEDEIRQAISFVTPDSRDIWVKMAFGIKAELGDDGFDIWDDWGRQSSDYDERASRHVWKSAKVGGNITIGTVIWEAQQRGFKLEAPETQVMTDEEIAERQRVRKAAKAKSAKEERERQKAAQELANQIWDEAKPVLDHPYLTKKQVGPHGLRVGRWPLRTKYGEVYGHSESVLLIPMRDAKGIITSLQGVFSELPKGYKQAKSYLRDGKKSGSWHMIGNIGDGGMIAYCEGYATGATIRELTGWCVIVCFDRSNLLTVAEIIRPMTQGQNMVICADNDQFTEGNPGVTDAKKAANAIGARVLVPQIPAANAENGYSDFNDLYATEGAAVAKKQLGIEPPAPPAPHDEPANDNEPFYPLGYNDGEYFYLVSGTQQITSLTASQHSKSNLIGLASLHYWNMEYPSKTGPAWDIAADEMMRQCEQRGYFTRKVIRGRGAWVDAKRTVFHFGSHLWVDGKMMRLTGIKSKFVYEMKEEINAPDDDALTDADGRNLVEIAQMFRWTKPANAALLAGFVALAPLCGALRWRPHVWITGGAGCGKTTVLNDYVHRLLNGMDIFAQGNSTEAGFRQTLGTDALPVIFDESEQNNEREASRVQNVLSLIRQASSESAAVTLKGTASGDAMQFIIRSMFCLSSIQVGMKHQADYERLTILALRPKEDNPGATTEWAKLKDRLYRIERDEGLPARLFKRSLDLLKTTLQNIMTFVDAAAEKFGSLREGDQYGTLLAGCWSLTSRELATPEQAKAMIDGYDWEELRENTKINESNLALNALISAELRTPVGGTASIYEIVCKAAGRIVEGVHMTTSEASAVLGRAGIRVEGGEIWLAYNSQKIVDVLRNTPYAADWKGQIVRADGVTKSAAPKKFNGLNSRYLIVPLSLFDDDPGSRDLPF